MAEMDEHMAAFVQEVLETFATEWIADAKDRITGRGIVEDGDLLNSVAMNVLPGELQALFQDSGRMHDMGAGNGYHKGKFMGPEDRAQFLKGRKPSLWYSRLTYGKIYGQGGLVDMLVNTYVKQVPKDLVREFNQNVK